MTTIAPTIEEMANDRRVRRILITTRGVRGFGDGLMAVGIPAYLTTIGFSPVEVGAVVTATLVGSSLLSLFAGLSAVRLGSRPLFMAATAAMIVSGGAFASLDTFLPLFLVALLGAMNPSASDSNMTAPLEQARMSEAVRGEQRTALFSRYTLVGSLATALGGLSAALPQLASAEFGIPLADALRGLFVAYGIIGLVLLTLYRFLPRETAPVGARPRALERSRRMLPQLAAVFALDSFGGGFAIQSILALWLFSQFDVSLAQVASILFAASMASSVSLLAAPLLARRIGLMNTMVFTHVPANVALLLVPFMPTLETAIGMLLVRSILGQLDIPARLSYVMAVVDPHERAAAASITSVVRGLSGALSPVLAGGLLAVSSFGWPLLVGGGVKLAYDVLFVRMFRKVPLAENA